MLVGGRNGDKPFKTLSSTLKSFGVVTAYVKMICYRGLWKLLLFKIGHKKRILSSDQARGEASLHNKFLSDIIVKSDTYKAFFGMRRNTERINAQILV